MWRSYWLPYMNIFSFYSPWLFGGWLTHLLALLYEYIFCFLKEIGNMNSNTLPPVERNILLTSE